MSASIALTRPDLIAGFGILAGRILPELEPQLADIVTSIVVKMGIGTSNTGKKCEEAKGITRRHGKRARHDGYRAVMHRGIARSDHWNLLSQGDPTLPSTE